jgi:hypothetical protein
MAAAQRLRDATHELVRQRASTERSQAIQKIDRTLAAVQGAMISLPDSLLLAEANATPSQKATDDLARAADRLNDAVAVLNKVDRSGGDDQRAIAEINSAISSVQLERSRLQGTQNADNTGDPRAAATNEGGASSQTQSLPQELKQKMQTAGFSNIEIIPGSYLVSAKNKNGKDVLMRIGPHSMTVLTASSTTGQGGSSQAQ